MKHTITLLTALLLAPLAALQAGDDGSIVGAIRWDAWYGDGSVTKAVEASLGQTNPCATSPLELFSR